MDCPVKFDLSLLKPRFWPTWLGVAVLFPFSLLSTSVRHKIAGWFGKIAYKRNSKRRNIVKANLSYCFPEYSKSKVGNLAQEHFKYAAIGMLEFCVHIFASKKRLKSMLIIDNQEYLDSVVDKQGVLFLLVHSPMLNFMATGIGKYKCKGTYNPFHNSVLDYLVLHARCRFASGLIPRQDGFRPIVRELKNKRPFVYLPDEDFGLKHATMVKFFAADKATLNIPARLVKITGCLAIPLMIVWDESINKYRMKSLPPLDNYPSGDAKTDARTLNQAFEKLIKPHLTQYMWTLKLFKTRPAGETSIY